MIHSSTLIPIFIYLKFKKKRLRILSCKSKCDILGSKRPINIQLNVCYPSQYQSSPPPPPTPQSHAAIPNPDWSKPALPSLLLAGLA